MTKVYRVKETALSDGTRWNKENRNATDIHGWFWVHAEDGDDTCFLARSVATNALFRWYSGEVEELDVGAD